MNMPAAVGIKGFVTTKLWTPRTNLLAVNKHGNRLAGMLLKDFQEMENLVTDNGDVYYGNAGAALNANATVSAPTGVKGMILSTQVTAATKTGAGSFIATGITGSNVAIDGSFPTATSPGAAQRITWETTWGAGVATNAAIGSAAIVNPTTFTLEVVNADQISYVVFGATIDKQAGDTLVVTWNHDLLGA